MAAKFTTSTSNSATGAKENTMIDMTIGAVLAHKQATICENPGCTTAYCKGCNKPVARPLHVIAEEIRADWKKVYFGAVPYLKAMARLDRMTDAYGCDSADSIVLYFLSNARTWKGETAKRIKAELKSMVK
jgi:hypothetical protein